MADTLSSLAAECKLVSGPFHEHSKTSAVMLCSRAEHAHAVSGRQVVPATRQVTKRGDINLVNILSSACFGT